MSTSKRPARPTDPLAWRDQLIAELENASKTAKGSLQEVLSKMSTLLGSSRPGGSLDKHLFQELQEAFARFAQDPAASRMPAVLTDCLEWIHTCFMSRSSPAAGKKSGHDSFESGAAQRARSLTGEAPVAAAAQQQPKDPQAQLESMKTWMLNPGLGKVKG
jgi:hypothetical protein